MHHGAGESSALERPPDLVSHRRAGPHLVRDTQRFMAERMHARVRSHPVDHTPIVTAPSLVVDIILEAIGEAISG